MTASVIETAAGSIADPRVLRAKAGEQVAFDDLVREFESAVYATCFRHLRQRESSEDAAQEALLNAWRYIDRAPAESFKPWLLRIAINTSLTYLRRQSRQKETALDTVFEPATEQPGPEREALYRELRDSVISALCSLPGAQRDVLLWHEQGRTYEEIAALSSSNVGTVKSRLWRARRGLLRILSGANLVDAPHRGRPTTELRTA
jgi:RNA polymerase sigma-70 factor, ECF subfamily